MTMIDEKINGQSVHHRKQKQPTKYKQAPKKRPAKKQVQIKQDPEVIEVLDDNAIHPESLITDQELAEATDALVKSSERFDELMKYYDIMPEKIDGPVDLAWLEENVAP